MLQDKANTDKKKLFIQLPLKHDKLNNYLLFKLYSLVAEKNKPTI